MYRRDRNLDDNGEVIRGGGVLMYITNNLKHYEIDHDVNNTESLWCTIQTAHGNSVKLGVCYDSTSNTKEDSDRLYNIMRTECQLNTIVCGDFNRPGINPIRSGGGGFKSPPLRFFALTHLILELHYCALVTFPKK